MSTTPSNSTEDINNGINSTNINTRQYTSSITISPSTTLEKLFTPTKIQYPIYKSSPLPTILETEIPQWIIENADRTGMTPGEIIYVFNILKNAMIDRNPSLLLDFLQFPIHENGRCPGDVIETPEEFVTRFTEIIDEGTRSELMNYSYKNIVFLNGLVGLGATKKMDEGSYFETIVWYGHECNSKKCDNNKILIKRLNNYVTQWELVDGYPRDKGNIPEPTYNPNKFIFGRYEAFSYNDITKIDEIKLDETKVPWRDFSITISETAITMEPNYNDAGTCSYTMVEFCPIDERKWSPGWFGFNWPYIQIICQDRVISPIYISGENQLAAYLSFFISPVNIGNPFIFFKLKE